MSIVRHLAALGLLAGIGYCYVEAQKSATVSPSSDEVVDPFADWEHIDTAPPFNVSAPPMQPNSADGHAPPPIPFSEFGTNDVIADKPNRGDTTKTPTDVVTQSRIHPPASTDSTTRHTGSIWDEPTVSGSSAQFHSTRSEPGIKPEGNGSQESGWASTVRTNQSVPAGTNTAADRLSQPSATDLNGVYRQYSLGSGPRKTVCVLDRTVTGNRQLLATVFAGIQQEWTSDVQRSQQQRLVILLADPQQQRSVEHHRAELQSWLNDIQPARIVHVLQTDQSRGTLNFTSHEESVAALLSAPGTYKIESNPQSAAVVSFPASHPLSAVQTVRLQLPADAALSGPQTVQLLSNTLNADWDDQLGLSEIGRANQGFPNFDVDNKSRMTKPELIDTNNVAGTNNARSNPSGNENMPSTKMISRNFIPDLPAAPDNSLSSDDAGDVASELGETTSSFFSKLYTDQFGGSTRSAPSQAAPLSRRYAPDRPAKTPASSLSNQAGSLWSSVLGDAAPIADAFADAVEAETGLTPFNSPARPTEQLIDQIESNVLSSQPRVPNPFDILPPEPKTQSPETQQPIENRRLSDELKQTITQPIVEFLQPPPAYRSDAGSATEPEKSFFKLPPPPGR